MPKGTIRRGGGALSRWLLSAAAVISAKIHKRARLTMWPDNETERDFLNFSGVADTVAEIIIQARGRPISIGVSGAWGIGKSSMIKLTQASLAKRPRKEGEREFIFVEFNAWLYQGYDDARAALMDVIATKLEAEAKAREKGLDKGKALSETGELAARGKAGWPGRPSRCRSACRPRG